MTTTAPFEQAIRLMGDGMDRDDALATAGVTLQEFNNYLKLTAGGANSSSERIGSQPEGEAPPTVESLAADLVVMKESLVDMHARLARLAGLLSQSAVALDP